MLDAGEHSHATDVWAFGVLVWEVFANGQEPWPGPIDQSINQSPINFAGVLPSQIKALIAEGQRLEPPDGL